MVQDVILVGMNFRVHRKSAEVQEKSLILAHATTSGSNYANTPSPCYSTQMGYLHKLGIQLRECAVSADLRLVDVVQALVELLCRGINN